MAVFTDLPAEVLLQIGNYLPHSSLVYLCSCSKHLHALLTPPLYATIIPGTLTGTLRLFRRLVKEPDAGYMGIYKDTVHAVILPKIAATHEVKAAIALALAQCIQSGYLPNLKELRWPFTFVRRGFLEEENAAQFDEPLYLALEETYSELDSLVVDNASHVPNESALWRLESRCRSFHAPRPAAQSGGMPWW